MGVVLVPCRCQICTVVDVLCALRENRFVPHSAARADKKCPPPPPPHTHTHTAQTGTLPYVPQDTGKICVLGPWKSSMSQTHIFPDCWRPQGPAGSIRHMRKPYVRHQLELLETPLQQSGFAALVRLFWGHRNPRGKLYRWCSTLLATSTVRLVRLVRWKTVDYS